MRHLTALVILVAATALVMTLWVNEGLLWRLVMTKRIAMPTFRMPPGSKSPAFPPVTRIPIYVNPETAIGWVTVRRWTDPPVAHGKAIERA